MERRRNQRFQTIGVDGTRTCSGSEMSTLVGASHPASVSIPRNDESGGGTNVLKKFWDKTEKMSRRGTNLLTAAGERGEREEMSRTIDCPRGSFVERSLQMMLHNGGMEWNLYGI